VTDDVTLPPLPEEGAGTMEVDEGPYTGPGAHLPHNQGARVIRFDTAYSADEMRAYAREAVLAEREQAACVAESWSDYSHPAGSIGPRIAAAIRNQTTNAKKTPPA